MDYKDCYHSCTTMLIEGALGIRLRKEYGLTPDKVVANASMIYQEDARKAMKEIFGQYIDIAKAYQLPIMLMTPTRKANKSNVEKSSFTEKIIQDNIDFLKEIREEAKQDGKLKYIFVGALMGCKGDAYKGTDVLTADEAYQFHSWQAQLFRKAGADFLYAGIMPAVSETIGMARAMGDTGIPYIISFMIRNNGRLIDGTTIHNAISAIEAATDIKPIFYMSNCVHPINVSLALNQEFNQTELVRTRFKGIQANASLLSPEELDHSCEIISSDPTELADEMLKLRDKYGLKVFGGCCGTDNTHVEELAKRLSIHRLRH